MLDITLKVPLAALDLGGFLQGHDPRASRVEMFHEALDRAALARRIASFEKDDDALTGLLDPALNLQQFDLQVLLLPFVFLAAHPPGVGIALRQGRLVAVLAGSLGRFGHHHGRRLIADGANFRRRTRIGITLIRIRMARDHIFSGFDGGLDGRRFWIVDGVLWSAHGGLHHAAVYLRDSTTNGLSGTCGADGCRRRTPNPGPVKKSQATGLNIIVNLNTMSPAWEGCRFGGPDRER